jgi:hypothetical protein
MADVLMVCVCLTAGAIVYLLGYRAGLDAGMKWITVEMEKTRVLEGLVSNG